MTNDKVINSFSGDFSFLSNFYDAKVFFEGLNYPTVEHAFQAAKSLDPVERRNIKEARTAGLAKRLGRKVNLRKDWDFVKVDVMLQLLRLKFKNPILKQKLIDTEGFDLEEGNNWGDMFWGVCSKTGVGKNWLGKLLMQVREEVKNEKSD